ncbi:hypothetical protein [Streptomyces sp. NPDC001903]|uniref:hypothetical protein n=1 Tax=Streptomyces sp. NPDC001903 TaxID=3364622 RepID=UPI0036873964
MTAFMEAVGYAPAALSALHALGALMRLWQHRRAGKSGPCGCAVPAAGEDSSPSSESGPLVQDRFSAAPAAVVTVTLEGLPAGAVTVVTVTTALGAPGRGRW